MAVLPFFKVGDPADVFGLRNPESFGSRDFEQLAPARNNGITGGISQRILQQVDQLFSRCPETQSMRIEFVKMQDATVIARNDDLGFG